MLVEVPEVRQKRVHPDRVAGDLRGAGRGLGPQQPQQGASSQRPEERRSLAGAMPVTQALQSPPLVLGVIILYILIQKLEGYVLVPKIMQKTVGTSPLVVLLALLIGFKLAGILGLLLAVPLAGAVTVIIQEFFHSKSSEPALLTDQN